MVQARIELITMYSGRTWSGQLRRYQPSCRRGCVPDDVLTSVSHKPQVPIIPERLVNISLLVGWIRHQHCISSHHNTRLRLNFNIWTLSISRFQTSLSTAHLPGALPVKHKASSASTHRTTSHHNELSRSPLLPPGFIQSLHQASAHFNLHTSLRFPSLLGNRCQHGNSVRCHHRGPRGAQGLL